MKLPVAPAIAAVFGGVVALGVLAIPTDLFENLVSASGLPAVLAAAEPPLGLTARITLALGAGSFVGLFGWFAGFVLLGSRTVILGAADEVDYDLVPTPVIRRADAHPDAPPRPPLLATRDLGRPFFETNPAEPEIVIEMQAIEQAAPIELPAPIEQALPIDLDQPLSAFDPDAVPDVPIEAPVLPPLRRAPTPPVFDETERFEVFELTPPVRPQPASVPLPLSLQPEPAEPAEDAIARPETEASVHALLDRLERGVQRKAMPITPPPRVERRARERGLEDALVTLRNMAKRA